jgi:hypothetical protein
MNSLIVTLNAQPACVVDLDSLEVASVVLDATPDLADAAHILVIGLGRTVDGQPEHQSWLDRDISPGTTIGIQFGPSTATTSPLSRQRADSPEHAASIQGLADLRAALDKGERTPRHIVLPVRPSTVSVRLAEESLCDAVASDDLPILTLTVLWYAARPTTYSTRMTSGPQGWPVDSDRRRIWFQHTPLTSQPLLVHIAPGG